MLWLRPSTSTIDGDGSIHGGHDQRCVRPPPSRLEDKLPKFPGIQTYPIEHHLSMAVIYRYFSEKKQRYDTHYEQLARQLGVPQPRARRLVREVWSRPRLDALDPSDIIAEVATGSTAAVDC